MRSSIPDRFNKGSPSLRDVGENSISQKNLFSRIKMDPHSHNVTITDGFKDFELKHSLSLKVMQANEEQQKTSKILSTVAGERYFGDMDRIQSTDT